jgi:aryl-alcohol dehydrogenase-like predicted oxidoreductase
MNTVPMSVGVPAASVLGLGCGRLGSVMTGQSAAEARALVSGAYDLGVRVFDTANIYGQGRSEAILGTALKDCHDVCIITKAGQVFPLRQRLLAPLRAPVAAILKRSGGTSSGLRAIRSMGLPRDYRPESLERDLAASLRRLRRSDVGIFLLHSPRAEHLVDRAALDALTDLKSRGLTQRIGVSCDDLDVLEMVSRDPRVDVIEAPYGIARRSMQSGLEAAAARGATIVAREILSFEAPLEKPPIAEAVSFCMSQGMVSIALLGTTNLQHLREAASYAVGTS